jgi:uncharacterized protein (DUF362 family)/Pyruvate/2-oxoacid:ferredoxin oxidoreductase delta subunit
MGKKETANPAIAPRVSLRKCSDYNADAISEIVGQCIADLGGIKKFTGSAKKILLKPNLLTPTPPELAVTTHPVFIEGVLKYLKSHMGPDTVFTIADSPGAAIPHTKKELQRLYDLCGLNYLQEDGRVILNTGEGFSEASYREGAVFKHLEVIDPILDADIIINLPKFKTHSLAQITGAVKNMYGILPGRNKTILHTKFLDIEKFCNMNLDIYMFAKPVLNIMDAITGLEGEGPGASGKKRDVGLVIASGSGVALDNLVSAIMGFKKNSVPVIQCASKRNIPGADIDNLEVFDGSGRVSDIEAYAISDFMKPGKSVVNIISGNRFVNSYFLPFARNSLSLSPFQDLDRCTMCGICIEVCPEQAISLSKKDKNRLEFDYKKCIRCYCCSEMCEYGAIKMKYSFIGNLIFGRKKVK